MQDHTSILFWNTKNNPVEDHLIRIINHHRIDILVLAESAYINKQDELLEIINKSLPQNTETFYRISHPENAKLHVLSRIPNASWSIEFARSRYTGWRYNMKSGATLLMVTAHFPSIQYDQGDGQRQTAIELRLDIEDYSKRFISMHPNLEPYVYIVGDMNANPFDPGIASIYGLNATSCRDTVVNDRSRVLNGRLVQYMYNPMWRFLDASQPQGTYYKRLASPLSYDWFVLDQVLMSQSLTNYFIEDDLQILTEDADLSFGGQSLISDRRRPNANISDHLPIMFRFKL